MPLAGTRRRIGPLALPRTVAESPWNTPHSPRMPRKATKLAVDEILVYPLRWGPVPLSACVILRIDPGLAGRLCSVNAGRIFPVRSGCNKGNPSWTL